MCPLGDGLAYSIYYPSNAPANTAGDLNAYHVLPDQAWSGSVSNFPFNQHFTATWYAKYYWDKVHDSDAYNQMTTMLTLGGRYGFRVIMRCDDAGLTGTINVGGNSNDQSIISVLYTGITPFQH